MPYNQDLAQRIRVQTAQQPGLDEKKMFGGIGFLLHGNMACGVHGEDLIVRVGPEKFAEALAQPGARPFDMTGRPMAGWVMVSAPGFETDEDLKKWIEQGVAYSHSLPKK